MITLYMPSISTANSIQCSFVGIWLVSRCMLSYKCLIILGLIERNGYDYVCNMGQDSDDDKIPLTRRGLPSVTQQTKARFQQLLDAALKNEAQATRRTPLPRPRGKKEQRNKLAKSEAVKTQSEDDSQSLWSSSVSDDRNSCSSVSDIVSKKQSHRNRITLLAEVHNIGKRDGNKSVSHHSNENLTEIAMQSSEDDLLTINEKMKPPRIMPRKRLGKHSAPVVDSEFNGNKNNSDENEQGSDSKNVESNVIESHRTTIDILENNNISDEDAPLKIDRNMTTTDDGDASCASVKVRTPIPMPRRSRSKPTSPKSNVPLDRGSMSDGNDKPLIKGAGISNKDDFHLLGVKGDERNENNFHPTLLKVNINNSNPVFSSSNENEYGADGDDALIKKKRTKKKRKSRKRSLPNNEEVGLTELKRPLSTGTSTTASSLETLRKRSCSGERSFSRKHSMPDGMIFGVTIHRTDVLQQHPLLRHPMVRVYIVDIATGQLINKSDPTRPVSFCDENVSYILPIMTHPFDLKQQRSLVPAWEEVLVFNENISHIVVPDTVIFFEVVDFVNFTSGSIRYRRLGHDSAWHRVAWAFLKLVAINGEMNTEKKLRLQLYKPKNRTTDSTKPAVYEWWKEGLLRCTKYPSTLYVTVGRVTPPQAPLTPNLRSRVVLQSERGSAASIAASQTDIDGGNNDIADENGTTAPSQHTDSSVRLTTSIIWSRLPAQSCKLTNNKHFMIPIAPSGGFAIEFSHSGLYLACGSAINIQVFDVPHFKKSTIITGHQGLIYKLRWSIDDVCLISSSADCTACVWDLRKKILSPQVLAHPSFVYCADFVPHFVRRTVISGCCDGTVRVWTRDKPALYRLAQEMPGHSGFVNALCFSTDSITFYSGDSVGDIKMWQYNPESGEWFCVRDIKVREIRGVVINNLSLHPGGNRMLLHTRDNMLRMIDIPTFAVIQWFHGSRNEHLQMNSCLTPCGGQLLSCSEDGLVCAWDSNTGIQLGLYNGLIMQSSSAAVTYHPCEHMMAVICYQIPNMTDVKSQPLYICDYDRCSSGESVGLKIFQVTNNNSISNSRSKENVNKSGIVKQMQSDDLWQKLEALSIERTKELHLGNAQGVVYFSTPKYIQDKEAAKFDGSLLSNKYDAKKQKRKKLFSDRTDNSWSKMSKISGFLVDKSITMDQKNNDSQNGFKRELNHSYENESVKVGSDYQQSLPYGSFGDQNNKSSNSYYNASILLDVIKRMDKVILESTATADSNV